MPKKIEVSIDEVLGTRKDISDGDGAIYKANVAPRSWDDEKRSARFIMSAETVDSYRDIVVQAGIDTESRFASNPVAFFGHRSYGFPIGSWSDLQRINGTPKRTEGTINFTAEGVDADADKAARHVKVGNVRAASIGFQPKNVERILDENGDWTYGYKFLEVELLECSVVSVPAVREALVRNAGASMKDIVSPEVIEEFLEHLKANPALAKMINRDVYEGVYREVTGNKQTIHLSSAVEIDAKSLDRMEAIAKRMEAAAATVSMSATPAVEDEPEFDPMTRELELSVEGFLKDFAPKVDEIDEPERKGALTKLMVGIRGIFKAAPETEPAKPDPEVLKALREQADQIAARYPEAA